MTKHPSFPNFHLNPAQSPTYFNLCRYLLERGWHSTELMEKAAFSEANFQFHLQAAETLEYKHLLAQLVKLYCPELMPLSHPINDENWLEVLTKVAKLNQDCAWILKPALLNNGSGIKIFQKISELEKHFLSSKRLGGEHLLQLYIKDPHLLRDKRKYSIRMFMILTNYGGAYLYPYGYFNVSLFPFARDDISDLRSHLTNEHLRDQENNVIQIPTREFKFFEEIYPKIKKQLSALISGLKHQYPQAFLSKKETRTLAIFGFDFMIDQYGSLWLLEANHGPCFPTEDNHPLQNPLYRPFWQHFIEGFAEPIALGKSCDKIQSPVFEFLNLD